MSEPPLSTSSISPIHAGQTPPAAQMAYGMEQVEAEEAFDGTQDIAFNPVAMAQRKDTLEAKRGKKGEESSSTKAERQERKIANVERIQAVSEKYERENPELQSRTLLLLRSSIKKGDSADEILRKIGEIYLDQALQDEAIDFLIETAMDTDMETAFKEVKEDLNNRFGREIRAGRNIGAQARAFSAQGLGSPTGLRDMYRDITVNPRDNLTLFDELNQKFTYEKMNTVIEFLFHSLGSDLKSKGPSISKGELHRLTTETRALQAILGLYRFFQARMRVIFGAFQRYSIVVPSRLTFINLAKQFSKLLQDKYPNIDKILTLAAEFGLYEVSDAQVILFSQYRDALRQVAPRLFRSEKHKNDLSMLLAMTLDRLHKKIEDESEEKQRKEEEENQRKKKEAKKKEEEKKKK